MNNKMKKTNFFLTFFDNKNDSEWQLYLKSEYGIKNNHQHKPNQFF